MKISGNEKEDSIINLAEFICESDAIENIIDDPTLLMEQIHQRKKDGHVGAMLILERLAQSATNEGGYLTRILICKIQELITAEQHLKKGGEKLHSTFVGHYRTCNVSIQMNRVTVKICPAPSVVPVEMTKLLDRAQDWQQNSRFYGWDYNLRYIASFHFNFLTIHPFADGNGRTSRALAYYMMRWAGLKPFVFTSQDKHEKYYPCFNDEGNPSSMQKYFLEKFGQKAS